MSTLTGEPDRPAGSQATGVHIRMGPYKLGDSKSCRRKPVAASHTSCSVPGDPIPASMGSSLRYGETRADGANPCEYPSARWHSPAGSVHNPG